jgi:NADH:ubiquinone oxidoreductase subunit E
MSATAAVNVSTPHEPEVVARVIAERGHLDGALMPVLHGVQDALGYVPSSAVAQIAQALKLSRSEVHGVIGYYRHFRQSPARGPVLQVCRAESCRSVGGEALLQQARAAVHCTVEAVHCLGLCAQSPAVMLEGQPHARMTPERLDELLADAGDFR